MTTAKLPVLFTAAEPLDCERCPERVQPGEPAAWLPDVDESVCFECGTATETAVGS